MRRLVAPACAGAHAPPGFARQQSMKRPSAAAVTTTGPPGTGSEKAPAASVCAGSPRQPCTRTRAPAIGAPPVASTTVPATEPTGVAHLSAAPATRTPRRTQAIRRRPAVIARSSLDPRPLLARLEAARDRHRLPADVERDGVVRTLGPQQ